MLLMPVFLLMAAAAEGTPVIQETFANAPQSPPWEWVREERDHWRAADGKLQIRALRGTLWKGDRNDAKNLLVRAWPTDAAEDSFISVTVRFAPEQGGEQAGVMFYFGDDDYVKLVRESLEGKRWIVMGREEKGKAEQVDKQAVEDDEVTLYLARHGDKIEGLYTVASKPGERPAIGNCTLPAPPAPETPLKFGVFAHGGPADAATARWATFSNLSVTNLPAKK